MLKVRNILILSLLILCKLEQSFAFNRVCYYTNWAQYRSERGYGFYPEDVDPFHCTHIIYAFAKIDNNQIVNFEENDIENWAGTGMYTRIMKLKDKNPKLKILIAIGGWNAGSWPFEQIIASQASMDLFAKNSVTFLRKWNFDGLDIDWEYPILHKQAFTVYLATLRKEYEADATRTGKERLLLTAAVGAGQATVDTAYEVDKMNIHIDMLNLMTYDLHGSWETKTGFHTGLYARPEEKEWEQTLNVDWATQYWIKLGMAPEKINLGLGFYGRGFSLKNPTVNAVGSPASGPSTAGKIVTESGMLSYFEICSAISAGARELWDAVQQVPSIQNGKDWIGYENERSLKIKVDYARSKCLGGIMLWALDFDDFKGKYCNKGNYPLMNAVIEAIGDGSCTNGATTIEPAEVFTNAAIITPKPETAAPLPTIPPAPVVAVCQGRLELVAIENDCSSFYLCIENFDKPVSKLSCPELKYFDKIRKTCTTEIPDACKPSTTAQTTATRVSTTQPTTAPQILTTQSPATVTTVMPDKIVCPSDSGIFAHPTDCNSFLSCSNKMVYVISCPPSLIFNEESQACDFFSPRCPNTRLKTSLNDLKGGQFVCPSNGLFADPVNCNAYYNCANNIPYSMKCPSTLVFNPENKVCDYSTSRACIELNLNLNRDRAENGFVLLNKTPKVSEDEGEFFCPERVGLYADPKDCTGFYNCFENIPYAQRCPFTLFWDEKRKICDTNDACLRKKFKRSANIKPKPVFDRREILLKKLEEHRY